MKKQLLISMLVAASAGLAFGQGKLSTSVGNVQIQVPKATPAPARIVPGPAKEGVVQVALRHGNPLQMLNPAAPPQYGNAHEHVSHDPNDPGKPKGIALFAWTF